MTLDSLFIPAEGTVVNSGGTPVIPLSEMPLGAFSEMVERHLGRDLTDEDGQDLATWLESATATLGPEQATQASAMAHMLVTMARQQATAPAETDSTDATATIDGAEGDTPTTTTLGSRIAAIARSIGLPIGPKTDSVEGAEAAASETAEETEPSEPSLTQPVATKPFSKPRMSRAERRAAIDATTAPPEPIVIDLRSEDPFQTGTTNGADIGGQAPVVSGSPTSIVDLRETLRATNTTVPAVPTPEGTQSQPADQAIGHAAQTVSATQVIEHAGSAAVRTKPTVVTTVEAGDTTITIDLSRFEAANPAAQRPNTPQVATANAPVQVPHAAVARVMQAIELQASTPPPRMAVVEIPELDGLRIMVSVNDTGAVAVTQLGNSGGESSHVPFMQTIIETLETRGFELDDRSRGRDARDERQNQDDRPRNRHQPRRQRDTGLLA